MCVTVSTVDEQTTDRLGCAAKESDAIFINARHARKTIFNSIKYRVRNYFWRILTCVRNCNPPKWIIINRIFFYYYYYYYVREFRRWNVVPEMAKEKGGKNRLFIFSLLGWNIHSKQSIIYAVIIKLVGKLKKEKKINESCARVTTTCIGLFGLNI